MNPIKAFFNAVIWALGYGPDVPNVDKIKQEREAACHAFRDAVKRRDSREAHHASNDLIRLTSALLRAEMAQ